jgi:hypothetical protein
MAVDSPRRRSDGMVVARVGRGLERAFDDALAEEAGAAQGLRRRAEREMLR